MLSSPFSDMITISPFSTSLTNLAPIMSKAQGSESKTYDSWSLPIIKGRIPKGSLTPINFLFVRIVNAYPPWILKIASIILSINLGLLDLAISCTIVSVSYVVWKIEPSSTNLFLICIALLRFPLCAMLNPPVWSWAKNGWTFTIKLFPAVE